MTPAAIRSMSPMTATSKANSLIRSTSPMTAKPHWRANSLSIKVPTATAATSPMATISDVELLGRDMAWIPLTSRAACRVRSLLALAARLFRRDSRLCA